MRHLRPPSSPPGVFIEGMNPETTGLENFAWHPDRGAVPAGKPGNGRGSPGICRVPGRSICMGSRTLHCPGFKACGIEEGYRGVSAAGGWPKQLPGGETRRFLEDGDEVIFRGRAERAGSAALGFGECRGIITS